MTRATPPHAPYTIERIRARFTRAGYRLRFFNPDGSRRFIWYRGAPMGEASEVFFGDDGRSVRADAVRFAKGAISGTLKGVRLSDVE
jgi:hypothetical protein